jgi:hypothetical protein
MKRVLTIAGSDSGGGAESGRLEGHYFIGDMGDVPLPPRKMHGSPGHP